MTWYRPPSASIDSFKQLERVNSFFDQGGHETILAGDTNYYFSFKHQMVDWNYNIPNHVELLVRNYEHHGYTQVVKEATKVTISTSFIIYHIATTNTNNIYQSGVIKRCISDHYIVFCIRKIQGTLKKQHKKQHKFMSRRRINNFEEQKFYDEAASLLWWYIVRKHDNVHSAVIILQRFW